MSHGIAREPLWGVSRPQEVSLQGTLKLWEAPLQEALPWVTSTSWEALQWGMSSTRKVSSPWGTSRQSVELVKRCHWAGLLHETRHSHASYNFQRNPMKSQLIGDAIKEDRKLIQSYTLNHDFDYHINHFIRRCCPTYMRLRTQINLTSHALKVLIT